MLTTAISNNGV